MQWVIEHWELLAGILAGVLLTGSLSGPAIVLLVKRIRTVAEMALVFATKLENAETTGGSAKMAKIGVKDHMLRKADAKVAAGIKDIAEAVDRDKKTPPARRLLRLLGKAAVKRFLPGVL